MVRIPSEYQEVEYLESTGGEFIETDVNPIFSDTDEFYMRFAYLNVKKTQIFFGTDVSNVTLQGVAIPKSGYLALRSTDICSPTSGNAYFYKNEWIDYHIVNQMLSCKDVVGSLKDFSKLSRHLCLLGKGGETSTRSVMRLSKAYYKRDGEYLMNLIPCYRLSDQEPGMYDTVTNNFFINSGTGTFLIGNDVHHSTVNLMESRRRILLNTPHIKSLSGSVLSFRTDVPFEMKECKVHFSPVQEGTGTPSPENVRPITGWDGVTVTACGKNLYSGEQIANLLGSAINQDENGRYTNVGSTESKDFPSGLFKENTRYTFLFKLQTNITTLCFHIIYTDGTTTSITGIAGISTVVVTSSANKTIKAIRSVLRNAERKLYIDESGIFEGVLTANDFKPYQATTLTIPFPRTIYGGYVDLVKGEVVEEWERRDMSEFSTINKSTGTSEPWVHRFSFNHWVSRKGYCVSASNNTMCDCLENSTGTVDGTFQGNSGYIYDSAISTVEEFRSKYAGHYIAYPFKNESFYNTIPLTNPPSIPVTLRGLNNIISNANGNIDVSFWSH